MSEAALIPVLVVDDGELQDIREMLAGLDVPYAEAVSTDQTEIAPELSLLVTNARHALDSDMPRPRSFIHLVVYDDVSVTLHDALHRSGCDLVLKRPVNPHTFRLLVSQALYAGPERRLGRRVVLSSPVELLVDGQTRPATLIQLSLRGCGLSTHEAVRTGSEIQLDFPRDLTGGNPLRVSGPVLSVRQPEPDSGLQEVAMAFRLMGVASRRIVSGIMTRHSSGAELRPRRPPPRARGPAAERTQGRMGEERLDGPRKSFTRRVPAAGAGITHMLIGRDLSPGGMRVRPEPDLALGDEIKLAVYGRPGHPAIMLKAAVVRDEGDDGLILRFHDVPGSIAARLEQLVEDLPEPPGECPAGSPPRPGVVVSEILGRR